MRTRAAFLARCCWRTMLSELALFAGGGGGLWASRYLLGWRTVCAVEKNPEARAMLKARQDDGSFDVCPIWDDVRTFDARPWRGRIGVVSGGFPCQGFSAAGRGSGFADARSGLWSEFARIIREVGSPFVFVENSPRLTSRGLGVVLGDLAALGYDSAWGCLSAIELGAWHERDRIWIVAHARGGRREGGGLPVRAQEKLAEAGGGSGDAPVPGANAHGLNGGDPEQWEAGERNPVQDGRCTDAPLHGEPQQLANANGERQPQSQGGLAQQWRRISYRGGWPIEPAVGRVAHGMAGRIHRIEALGNGQVPLVAATAFRVLSARLGIG